MSRIARFTALAALAATTTLGGASVASADSGAQGAAVGSPGVLSGNVVQVPVHIPVNVCGNSVNVVGFLNPAFGNTCANGSGDRWRDDHKSGADHKNGHWGKKNHDKRAMMHHDKGAMMHHGWGHR